MTTTKTDVAPRKAVRSPLRIPTTILHLAAMGALGWAVLSILIGIFSAGVSLILVLGIGLLLLVGLVYAIFGVAWLETTRVDGLYLLGAPPLRLRKQSEPGFKAYVMTFLRQTIDGRMWAALANFLIASTLGVFLIAMVHLFIVSIGAIVLGLMGVPETWSLSSVWGVFFGSSAATSTTLLVLGIIGAILAPVLVVVTSLLHRSISIGIIGSVARVSTLEQSARTSARQREGAVRAADVERTRIERDLHDGVQPRLVSVGMTLGLASQQVEQDPTAAKQLIDEAHTSTKAAITELRQLARGIHASVLDDRGLDAALSALAGRSHVPIQLDVQMPHRVGRDAEAAVYFAVSEALTNAAKHSRASSCRVTVRLRDDATLWARVEDNGVGGAVVQPGGGLDGISNRVQAAGGTARLDSPNGGPTALEVTVPCAS
ncbi:sensor histidine kinase [uncultured Agrococcus sp.]|uniref:sensor histidine kinase n=1 Tax=uncultured Agrococcus sp. TaxID=382258 RepID=UPI0025FA875C|nr:sensor histidine kinase [uncultured Agrococcus sp.]